MKRPSYLDLLHNGELMKKVNILNKMLEECVLCPHQCKVNRKKGERGYCRTLENPIVSGAQPHFGEEQELIGNYGSGTIFFSHCNLGCVFCQNYEISHCGEGEEVSVNRLAAMMIYLKNKGCHNINLVSPSHIVPQIVEAIFIASQNGLDIPIVFNSNGYDLTDTIGLLDGIVDIYMPDIKFSDDNVAFKYLGVKDYYSIAKNAVIEMYKQVGNLKTDQNGIAYRGLLIRHLVMPYNIAGTEKIMQFISDKLSKDTYVNIMAQYYPSYKAHDIERLKRRITLDEYEAAVNAAKEAGLRNYKYNM
ncbi:radical SAM protein [Brassicibacter mesophilus]|uniref:radical SAM protein n=1 Tax=Brassicibacter mesophilus TaxID=745119 RepID=UPI003D22542D